MQNIEGKKILKYVTEVALDIYELKLIVLEIVL